MNDTSALMMSKYYRLIMAKSRQERLRMGCSMFDTAKKIVRSAILNQNPEITAARMKAEVFLRFYGNEFSAIEQKKILNGLRSGDLSPEHLNHGDHPSADGHGEDYFPPGRISTG